MSILETCQTDNVKVLSLFIGCGIGKSESVFDVPVCDLSLDGSLFHHSIIASASIMDSCKY
jgi:hypothetical protein